MQRCFVQGCIVHGGIVHRGIVHGGIVHGGIVHDASVYVAVLFDDGRRDGRTDKQADSRSWILNFKFCDIICGGSDQLGKNITSNIAENGQKGRKKGGQCGQIWGSLYEMMKVVRGPLLATAVICLLLPGRIRAYFVSFPCFRFGSISFQMMSLWRSTLK